MATSKLTIAGKSRAEYLTVDPGTATDGPYVRSVSGTKLQLVTNDELNAENCLLYANDNSPGAMTANTSNLNAMIGATNVSTIFFNNPKGGVYYFSGSVVIPQGKTLKISRGNSLGGTFTISVSGDSIEAGGYKIFQDTVTITTPDTDFKNVRFKPGWIGVTPIYKRGDWYFDANDTTSTNDGAMVLVGGARRLKRMANRIIYPEFWGAIGDNSTNDGPAFNLMFRWMESQTRFAATYPVMFSSNQYYSSISIILPKTLQVAINDVAPMLLISGYGVTIRTDADINLFNRFPANYSDIAATNDNYKLVWEGVVLLGNRVSTVSVGMNVSCIYGGQFRDVEFNGFGTGFIGSFLTKCKWDNVFFGVNLVDGIVLQSLNGIISGADIAGTACNMNYLQDSRIFCIDNASAAIRLLGTDNTVIRHTIIEGAQPDYGIYCDYQGSSVENTLIVDDIWFEGYSNDAGVNFRIRNAGVTTISNIQRTYSDKLFDFSGCPSGSLIELENFTYGGNLDAVPFAMDGTGSGVSIKVSGSEGNLNTLLKDPTKWRDGVAPQNLMIERFLGSNGGYTIESTGPINIYPRVNADPQDRYLNIDGNLSWDTDNRGSLGGVYNEASNRPKAGHFGTGGVYIDEAGRLYFGRIGTGRPAPDLSLYRRPNVLVIDTTGAVALPSGTSTQQPDVSSSIEGMLRWDTDAKVFKQFDGTAWKGFLATLPPDDYYISTTNDGSITVGATSAAFSAYIGWRGRMYKNTAKMKLVDTGSFSADSATVDAGEGLYAYQKSTGTYHWREGADINDTFQFEAY